jgi:hypothetical protein
VIVYYAIYILAKSNDFKVSINSFLNFFII